MHERGGDDWAAESPRDYLRERWYVLELVLWEEKRKARPGVELRTP